MKTKIFGLLAVGLFAGPVAVNAAAVTMSAGDTVIFNFDLTTASPGPTYSRIEVYYGFSDFLDAGDANTHVFFVDSNAAGTSFGGGNLFAGSANFLDLGAMDGIFSLRVKALGGSFLVDPYAIGYVGTNATARVFPTIGAAVPEPGTLALLGLGLAGLGLSRRRKAN